MEKHVCTNCGNKCPWTGQVKCPSWKPSYEYLERDNKKLRRVMKLFILGCSLGMCLIIITDMFKAPSEFGLDQFNLTFSDKEYQCTKIEH